MSAQEFKPGDRVEYVGSRGGGFETRGLIGSFGTVTTIVRLHANSVAVIWDGTDYTDSVLATNVRKVEPEFVVGQKVSGDDYARLPVGSKAVWKHCADSDGLPAEKITVGRWREGSAPNSPIRTDAEMSLPRTLTHLGDGTHAEPEDKDDLYVEPEPLKEGDGEPVIQPLETDDWALAWVQVLPSGQARANGWDYRVSIGGTQVTCFVRTDAIVRPADGATPPWVKPARCTSLREFNKDHSAYRRCGLDEHAPEDDHEDGFGNTWTDAEAYGRVVESGGAS